MNVEQAKEKLMFHSCSHPHIEDERWINGFMGSLRPFKGRLNDDNFHDVMACLKSLSSYLRESNLLDKQIVSAVTNIIYFGRAWAVEEEGMLRSNQLISDADVEKMDVWLSCLSDAFSMLLEGCDEKAAFELYHHEL
jgi:hypothetical protein